jgi:hypothetical protein
MFRPHRTDLSRLKRLLIVAMGMTALLQAFVPAHADVQLGAVTFTHASYDYAPSVMVETSGLQRFWWCSASNGTDHIFYRSRDPNTGVWSAAVTITLTPAPTAGATWDGRHQCDPAVVKGSFVYQGSTYAFALYYTANACAEHDVANNRVFESTNSIGIAFSNDGINWVRRPTPILVSKDISSAPTTCPAHTATSWQNHIYHTYGAGQASVYQRPTEFGGGLEIYYTDTTTIEACPVVNGTPDCGQPRTATHIYLTQSTDYSSRVQVTSAGALPDGSGFSMANSDFALDNGSPARYVYAALALPGRGGDRESFQFGLFRMPRAGLVAGIDSWEHLGYIDENLTGAYINAGPGFQRNPSGWVTPDAVGTPLQVHFAAGANANTTWDLTWAQWRPSVPRIRLDRYRNTTTGDHWIKTGYVPLSPWSHETHELGYLESQPGPNRTVLYSCLDRGTQDHFISTARLCEDTSTTDRVPVGTVGWTYSVDLPNSVKVYSCRVTSNGDRFLSNSSNCESQTMLSAQPLGYNPLTPT